MRTRLGQVRTGEGRGKTEGEDRGRTEGGQGEDRGRTDRCLTGSLTMNSSLTVYGVCKHFSVDHPVRHVENVSGQTPRRLLVRVEDRLPSYAETHQHHQHDDHEVQHVDHLEDGQSRDSVFMDELLHVNRVNHHRFS